MAAAGLEKELTPPGAGRAACARLEFGFSGIKRTTGSYYKFSKNPALDASLAASWPGLRVLSRGH